MTEVASADPATASSEATTAPDRQRWWNRLWIHAISLTVVLVAAGAAVGWRGSFLPDEGAIIIQARMLSRGEGWVQRPPLPAVDPTGRWFPLDNVDVGAHGFAPLSKHPLYALLAAVAYRLGRVPGIIGLSMLGTVCAALLSAALARRFAPGLGVTCLWAVGLASPLFFDGLMALGTTMAAALGTAAVLLTVTLTRGGQALPTTSSAEPSWQGTLFASAGIAGCMATATLLRTEALIFALSLAAVATLAGLVKRLAPLVSAGVAATVGGWVGHQAEKALSVGLIGRPGVPAPPSGTADHTSFLWGRLTGFGYTWLAPSKYNLRPVDDALLAMGVVLLAGLAVELRRRQPDFGRLAILGGSAAAAVVARLCLAPWEPVPGLLVAFPLLVAGAVVIRRTDLDVVATLCVGTGVLFAAGVLFTQYPNGGSLEWGGRYFAMAMPVAVPPLLAGLKRRLEPLPRRTARAAVGALVLCSGGLALLAVVSLASQHASNHKLVAAISAASLTPSDVVVTNVPWIRRLAWSNQSDKWLHVPDPELAQAGAGIRAAGAPGIVLVTVDVGCPQSALPGWSSARHRRLVVNARAWDISTMAPGSTPPCGQRP